MRRQDSNGGAGEMVRLRATWVVEYDANPEDYVHVGAESPQEMAEVDATDDPVGLMADAETVSFTVEAVES